ncbi:EAL domain-containing protein [Frigidibacter albus]|uniref:EAL domain-containing protein n=1 Tax=Frigidibacter albus TaxID=1465486 RepID=A0A6L8VGC5_9RHOB|nr:GGDEF domain-containing phosphodiesterase [Frigidibacter albus]MZQ88771.1 EAL domain-containing protein [Frigidibacter albus]NBE30420.1 EAL domain-containing protein [Frigidibacter albus]GGH50384.1 diguanylate cyclase [Frigidibacter albus]
MADRGAEPDTGLTMRIAAQLRRPEMLAFVPAVMLAAFWFGGEGALLSAALALPIALAVMRASPPAQGQPGRDHITGLPLRDTAVSTLDAALAACRLDGRTTACLVLCLDEADLLLDRHGHAAWTQILRRTSERLQGMLREHDRVMRLDGARFAITLGPVRHADLESLIQIAARLQSAAELPLSIDASTLYVRASVGFCLAARAPHGTGESLLCAAEAALEEARQQGPGAIRAYSAELQRASIARDTLATEAAAALESGQILAYFQPQLCTDTGEVSGLEALARWQHPTRGVLPPSDFIAVMQDAGLSGRLSEVMLFQALTALRSWDKAGLPVPTVAVNFCKEDLRNPRLADRIKWELDRFDLQPQRLTVEILESVVADTGDEVIVRNIAALARLGCSIDLDDFGTGHASIANIRRFDVHRLKIDRSFVTKVDTDPGQQRMVAAILSMAERLDLQTLAEGVETTGEHALLAQLGCGHVQGFGIARPMPFDDSLGWLSRHKAKLAHPPRIGRRTG